MIADGVVVPGDRRLDQLAVADADALRGAGVVDVEEVAVDGGDRAGRVDRGAQRLGPADRAGVDVVDGGAAGEVGGERVGAQPAVGVVPVERGELRRPARPAGLPWWSPGRRPAPGRGRRPMRWRLAVAGSAARLTEPAEREEAGGASSAAVQATDAGRRRRSPVPVRPELSSGVSSRTPVRRADRLRVRMDDSQPDGEQKFQDVPTKPKENFRSARRRGHDEGHGRCGRALRRRSHSGAVTPPASTSRSASGTRCWCGSA